MTSPDTLVRATLMSKPSTLADAGLCRAARESAETSATKFTGNTHC